MRYLQHFLNNDKEKNNMIESKLMNKPDDKHRAPVSASGASTDTLSVGSVPTGSLRSLVPILPASTPLISASLPEQKTNCTTSR